MNPAHPIAAALLLLAAAPAAADYDPIVIARGWQEVDATRDGDCAGEVRTNGQFYVLMVTGLEPGADGRLYLTNGDMKPIDRAVHARADGTWQEYYVPFRPNRLDGDTVEATITTAACQIPLRFEWRRNLGWDEPGPL
ncbi:MAG: hypothetical protein ACTHKM_00890 [Tsuneonella sp.]